MWNTRKRLSCVYISTEQWESQSWNFMTTTLTRTNKCSDVKIRFAMTLGNAGRTFCIAESNSAVFIFRPRFGHLLRCLRRLQWLTFRVFSGKVNPLVCLNKYTGNCEWQLDDTLKCEWFRPWFLLYAAPPEQDGGGEKANCASRCSNFAWRITYFDIAPLGEAAWVWNPALRCSRTLLYRAYRYFIRYDKARTIKKNCQVLSGFLF